MLEMCKARCFALGIAGEYHYRKLGFLKKMLHIDQIKLIHKNSKTDFSSFSNLVAILGDEFVERNST